MQIIICNQGLKGHKVTNPISAFLIVKNEEARLGRTLQALQPWVDEIVVVDSGSTDDTIDIARSYGAWVYERSWTGYGSQKKFAEEQCRNEWVLNVDADEVISPELANEIQLLFAGGVPPAPAAYRTKILNVYPGEAKPRPLANDYNVVRLYHKAAGSYRDHPVHDRVELKDVQPIQLQAPIYHHPFTSFAHVIEKNNNFSSFRSTHSSERSLAYLKARLLIEFPLNFVKTYFFRRHFTGGWKGFYFSLCHAFMRTSRIAKMLENPQAMPAKKTDSQAFPVMQTATGDQRHSTFH